MDYTLLLVLHAAILMGLLAGIVGCFALLRQQSLLGDAISHAAFPGIVLMFLATHSKNPVVLLSGGALAGSCGVFLVNYMVTHTRLKKDTVLGIILSVFFGCGLVLLSIVQKSPFAQQAILNKFLFGTIATVLPEDLIIIQLVTLAVIGIVIVLWKELKIYLFDPLQTYLCGYNTQILESGMMVLLIMTIVVGLQVVGVVLMSALLIAPAAAARQWVYCLGHMVLLAGIFGSISGVVGVLLSSTTNHIPTGPMIVVVASCIVIISLLCGNKLRHVLFTRQLL